MFCAFSFMSVLLSKEKMDMEEKIYYGSEKSMMVFDDISVIPRNADGEIELSRLLVFVC